ncbi:MAG: magnesium/cobalt efflux protein, partial [Ruminococcaceae bacterium]|nr:magnesium/cobalt efflux protein [Oscillospiraceae bacterium]
LKRVPVKGDKFTVDNLEILVSALDAHRVSYVTVKQITPEAEATE